MGANENGKLDMANRIELLKKLKEELNNALTDIGGGKDVLEELHKGNHEYIFLLLLAQKAELEMLRKDLEKNKEELEKVKEAKDEQKKDDTFIGVTKEELKKDETFREEAKEALKKDETFKGEVKNEVIKEIKEIIKEINNWLRCPITFLGGSLIKNYKYAEQLYNWLLPNVDILDPLIPGFSKSWRNNRNNFDGMTGLVRAARKLLKT